MPGKIERPWRPSTPVHGGWFACSKAYIAHIPIKIPPTADEKRKAARITESVRAIIAAKTRLRAGSPPLAGVKGGLRADRVKNGIEFAHRVASSTILISSFVRP
ncbi:MAG: hypothetical protein FLDDKLPJ_00303 [Phycisphaerae bacterium]|nr:hypothetical protein [Phycisphaerae bacterium]